LGYSSFRDEVSEEWRRFVLTVAYIW